MADEEIPLRAVTPGLSEPREIPVLRVIALATGIAAVLALSVAAQTYLSMLDHGHSFGRILIWQLSVWSFWGLVAPFVLRLGADLAERSTRGWRDYLRVIGLGTGVIVVHGIIAAQLTIWTQPFVPVVTYRSSQALVRELPAGSSIDLLVYVLLLVGGGAFSVRHRARQLQLRESRLEAELARAQLDALRLEIEPHFLFNSLNSIAALIRLKENGRALAMLVGLSEFMRTALDRRREQFVPFSSELEWVKRYVSLQQTRFGDRLEVVYQVDDWCLDLPVPSLLLQPLVENALRHGAARQSERCRVVISAALEHHRLKVSITDDGVGLPAGFDITRDSGIGLRNTRSRLEQIYGAAARLDIRRGERAGTAVEIAVPVPPRRLPAEKATA